ncbi:MAG: GAF domain-containing protein [Bacteroidales bacterium]|nr:GAF domain-containing protein [Bacteroidales bacterium]
MKSRFHFTVKLKLIIGFSILGILLFVMFKTLSDTQRGNADKLSENIDLNYPSMLYTEKLKDLIQESQFLVTKWTLKGDVHDTKLLNEIESCHGELYDSLRSKIVGFVDKDRWSDKNKDLYFKLTATVDTLFSLQGDVLDNLSNEEKFADATNYSFTKFNLLEGELSNCYKRSFRMATQLANSFFNASRNSLEDTDIHLEEAHDTLQYSVLIFFGLMIIIAFILGHSLVTPVNYVKDKIVEMAKGSLPEVTPLRNNDEIGEMSEALKTLVSNLKETSQFAINIGEGDFSTAFKPQSKQDVLANSLLVMRDNLIKADKDAEQRKIENSQRNWASQGLAEFNEVLRNAGDDMQVLSNRVIEKLVRFLDANMGGIYIVDDSDENDIHLELTAFYAYDRLKYVKQRIEIGENLVGQCFRENETVYLTDLPKGYVHISSGLGEADPTCLVIVPLKVNAETYGIVELASFQVIEKYQVEFIEKIGETIAASIANVKINMNTQKLLEESHQKSERLAQQEAEVHKNIETLKSQIESLQDQNKRETIKYQKLHDDFENQAETNSSVIQKLNEKNEQLKNDYMKHQFILNNSAGYYELDPQGFYVLMNNRLLNSIDMPINEIENHDIRSFMSSQDVENFNTILGKLSEGLIHTGTTKYVFDGKTVYLHETFTPFRDEYNVLIKICVIAQNITQTVNRTAELERQVNDLKADNEILNARILGLQ